jgi:uncharacterized protein YdhG (YjbR/CyaY superfamily)
VTGDAWPTIGSSAVRSEVRPDLTSHMRLKSMAATRSKPANIDEYISAFSPEVQVILQQVRRVVRSAAPEAQEVISYLMPAFKQHGVLVYFAAFKNHIGFYPPVKGDKRLEEAAAPYAGEKGNLRFPLDEPIPFELIKRLTECRVKQDVANAAERRKKGRA